MYISFRDNVYLVEGKKKDCIYDLNNGKLYHIEKFASEQIQKYYSNSIETVGNEFISFLLGNNIVKLTDKKNKLTDIKNISQEVNITFAWIEICDICNLKCIHCYNESSINCINIMSLENFKKVCAKLKDIDINKIQIIGGEPFLHPNIKEILSYAAEIFESVEVFTNGTLLNKELLELIRQLRIKVALSVYSYDSTQHDKVTQVNGSHKRTEMAIASLKRLNITYRVASVLMNGIDIGKPNTQLYSINMKKDVVRLTGRGNKNMLTPELLKKRLITKETFSQPLNSQNIKIQTNHHQCFSRRIYISAILDVYPCVMERRICHGNILNHSIPEVLKEDILHMNKDKIDECKECEFRYVCFDCRPNTIADLHSKPYYCTYDVINGKWLDVDEYIANFFKI